MKVFLYSHLVIYTIEPEQSETKIKIGDVWVLKVGNILIGLYCCQGDCYPGMLTNEGSITLELLKVLPSISRIDSFPIILQMRPDPTKRHWMALFAR